MRCSSSLDHQPQASTSGRWEQPPVSHRWRARSRTPQIIRAAGGVDGHLGKITLLDYGAGNVRSVRNAIKRLGYTLKDVSSLLLCARGSIVA
jgi:glutamine amidotransferase/cyclase